MTPEEIGLLIELLHGTNMSEEEIDNEQETTRYFKS